MKEIFASLFTMAALGAGYMTYTSQHPAIDADYAGLMLPHLQAAFAPLDPYQGKLSEQPLVQLRQLVARDDDKPGAREAARLIDELLPILAERETYRAKLNNGASDTSNAFFNERISKNWLIRANVLAPTLQRDYANLVTLRERGGKVVQIPAGYEPYFDGSRTIAARSPLDEHARPATLGFGSLNQSGATTYTYVNPQQQVIQQQVPSQTVVVDPLHPDIRVTEPHRLGEGYRSPFDDHRSPIGEHRAPEEHHGPFEPNQPRPVVNPQKPVVPRHLPTTVVNPTAPITTH
jgi:hypothetical protein